MSGECAVSETRRVLTVTAWVESLYGGPGWHVVGGCDNCRAPLEDGDLAIVVEVNEGFTGAACLNCVAGWDLPALAPISSPGGDSAHERTDLWRSA